ncbi:major facilitator superfamily domain-containing protein [Rhizophagus diaphanus]|nr:major facilitator superfamily domain-containing protein [Rhizophagus diaphanus] [Rhizophagus sp. MUCL 43196]
MKENINYELLTDSTTSLVDDSPRNWSAKKKRNVLILISATGIIGSIGNLSFNPAILIVREDLNTTETLVNTAVASYLYVNGIAPLFWATYSDLQGTRRKVFLFDAFLIILTSNRVLAVQCLSVGTLSDIYNATERGNAIGVFYLGFFIGLVIGPPIGGFLTQYISWRSLFWFIAIFATIRLFLIFIFLPETYNKPSTTNSSQSVFNPLAPILLLRHANVTLVILYWIWIISIHFVVNILIPTKFHLTYGATTSEIGLIFLAPGAGLVLGSFAGGRVSDFLLKRNIKKRDGSCYPELRLHGAWWGASLIPLCYFCFGWFIEYEVFIVYPVVAMFIGAFVSQIATNSCETYLIDSYPKSSASIVALSNVCKCIVAPSMLIAAAPIDHSVGTGPCSGEKGFEAVNDICHIIGEWYNIVLECYNDGLAEDRKFDSFYKLYSLVSNDETIKK